MTDYYFKAYEIRKMFESLKELQEYEEDLKELNIRLDEDISPAMTEPTELGLVVRCRSVEQIVIEREEAREMIVKKIESLKRDTALLFDAMERLSERERDVVRALHHGHTLIFNQLTHGYTEELIRGIIEKLYGHIVEIHDKSKLTLQQQQLEERKQKAQLLVV